MPFTSTRRTLLVALLLVPLALGTLIYAELIWLWAGLSLLFLFFLCCDFLSLIGGAAPEVKRIFPAETGLGYEFELKLRIHNQRARPLDAELHQMFPENFEKELLEKTLDEDSKVLSQRSQSGQEAFAEGLHFKLGAGEKKDFSYSCKLYERGKFELAPISLSSRGYFGLLRRNYVLEAPASIKGIPGIEILQHQRLLLQAFQDAQVGPSRSRGVGRAGEFSSLTPYLPGDPPSSVDWKAYARSGILAVKRYEPERRRSIVLCCDLGRSMGMRVKEKRKSDLALEALMRLAAVALKRDDEVGLVLFDQKVKLFSPPQMNTQGYLGRLMSASLEVESNSFESAFTPVCTRLSRDLKRRSFIIFVSDCDDLHRAEDLQRNLASLTKRHRVLLCMLTNPLYSQFLLEPVRDNAQAYEQLALLGLLEERERVFNQFKKTGSFFLEVEPEAISAPLLNFYTKIMTGKAKSKLRA